MAAWKLRTDGRVREPLTIYQLQHLVTSGQAGPDAEVASDGDWARVADVPALARFLPAPTAAPEPGSKVLVHGMTLETGPDGRPLPPPPEAIAALLARDVPATPRPDAAKSFRRIVLVLSVLGLVAALAALASLTSHARP